MALVTERALVLRRYPWGESSLVVHLLTPRRGRVHLAARGAFRPTARYFAALDIFATLEVEYSIRPRADLGNLRRAKALEVLAGSKLLVLSSHNEGGPAVVPEAIACGVPVLSTRIPAAEALLGADHPGLFPIGDMDALASLLSRCEQNEGFLAELKGRSVDLLPSVDPCREAEDLRRLLAGLPIPNPRAESPPLQAPE